MKCRNPAAEVEVNGNCHISNTHDIYPSQTPIQSALIGSDVKGFQVVSTPQALPAIHMIHFDIVDLIKQIVLVLFDCQDGEQCSCNTPFSKQLSDLKNKNMLSFILNLTLPFPSATIPK